MKCFPKDVIMTVPENYQAIFGLPWENQLFLFLLCNEIKCRTCFKPFNLLFVVRMV